jgi:hypothetical protein
MDITKDYLRQEFKCIPGSVTRSGTNLCLNQEDTLYSFNTLLKKFRIFAAETREDAVPQVPAFHGDPLIIRVDLINEDQTPAINTGGVVNTEVVLQVKTTTNFNFSIVDGIDLGILPVIGEADPYQVSGGKH